MTRGYVLASHCLQGFSLAGNLVDFLKRNSAEKRGKDTTRRSEPTLAKTIAAINNFVVGLSQKLGYSNLASARRTFDARIATQLP